MQSPNMGMTKKMFPAVFVQLKTGTTMTGIINKHGLINGPAHLSCLCHLFYLQKRKKNMQQKSR